MRFSSLGLHLLLIGACGAAPNKSINDVKQQANQVARAPPPPNTPHPTWKPPKPDPNAPLPIPPRATILYRGEHFRGPDEVRKAGGFDSHAKRILEKKHPTIKALTPEMFKRGSSLVQHGEFKCDVSSYVLASRSEDKAKNFATREESETRFVYAIRPSSDMVDVQGSLGGDRYYKNAHEEEVAGVYDIPWSQVISWRVVKKNPQTRDWEFVGQPQKNDKFVEPKNTHYQTHYQLAGWQEGAVAWDHPSYKPYKKRAVEEFLNEHLLKFRFKGNVKAFQKFRGDKRWAVLPKSKGGKREAGVPDIEPQASQGAGHDLKGRDTRERGPLIIGQGYSTFLGKGVKPRAAILPSANGTPPEVNNRRNVPEGPSANALGQPTKLPFKEPTGNLSGIDAKSYFTSELEADLELLRKLEGNSKSKREDDPKPPAPSPPKGDSCTGEMPKKYEFVRDYTSYLKTLGISLSATVSGYGQSATVSGSYLDQAQITEDSLTYVVIIEVTRQDEMKKDFKFNTALYDQNKESFFAEFGDRFVRDFYKGGKMIARIAFKSKESSDKRELKAKVDLAMGYWGVKGDASAEVKQNMEEVNKRTTLSVSLFYQGDISKLGGQEEAPEKIEGKPVEAAFQEVRRWGETFVKNACSHDYYLKPYLEEYRFADGFPNSQKIPDYSMAKDASAVILPRLVKVSEMAAYLRTLNLNGDEIQKIEMEYLDMQEAGRSWARNVAADPTKTKKLTEDLLFKLNKDFIGKHQHYLDIDYISGIKVVYGHEPAERLTDLSGDGSPDINKYDGGEDVFLVPQYTKNRNDACTSFELKIQSNSIAGLDDMAKGAGGDYRYLICKHEPNKQPIRRVGIYRLQDRVDRYIADKTKGFTHRTGDINSGRDGWLLYKMHVYLLWGY